MWLRGTLYTGNIHCTVIQFPKLLNYAFKVITKVQLPEVVKYYLSTPTDANYLALCTDTHPSVSLKGEWLK